MVRIDRENKPNAQEFNKALESMSVMNCKDLYRVGKDWIYRV
jgi:hypothetical protein